MDYSQWHKWFAWFPVHVEVLPPSSVNHLSSYFVFGTYILRKKENNAWRYKRYLAEYKQTSTTYIDCIVETGIEKNRIYLMQQYYNFYKLYGVSNGKMLLQMVDGGY